MALLFYSEVDDPVAWREALRAHVPDLDFRTYPDFGDARDIDSCLVWKPPANLFQQFPNLRAIFSLAAGVDALLADPTLPDVPICRMVDRSLSFGMGEFVLAGALHIHRDLHRYRAQQRAENWHLILPRPPADTKIGVLGLGEMGQAITTTLVRHGFSVMGWSRTLKELPSVTCFAGPAGLREMAGQSDILVCVLPLTAATTGLLNAELFNAMPPGSALIQVGRGPQLVEEDLLGALEGGRLDYAILDVFGVEPLPKGHVFWQHPKIMITPHAASYSTPQSGSVTVADNLRQLAAGQPLGHVVDRQRGY